MKQPKSAKNAQVGGEPGGSSGSPLSPLSTIDARAVKNPLLIRLVVAGKTVVRIAADVDANTCL